MSQIIHSLFVKQLIRSSLYWCTVGLLFINFALLAHIPPVMLKISETFIVKALKWNEPVLSSTSIFRWITGLSLALMSYDSVNILKPSNQILNMEISTFCSPSARSKLSSWEWLSHQGPPPRGHWHRPPDCSPAYHGADEVHGKG